MQNPREEYSANTSRSFAPNGFPVIKECRNVPSRLRRSGIRYHAGVIDTVTYRGRKCELSVNLGGNAGPGSRPKGTKGTGYFFIQEENNMTVWEELKARGLIAQVTDEDEIKEMVNNGKATFYIGFDPTADSLHVGHFMALCLMKRLQMAGNRPIALLGGGTGMIGDPSGRTDMRQMLTKETIQHNIDCFKKQMERFIDFSDGKALMVNNAEWLMNLNYVELLTRGWRPLFR